MLCCKKGEWVIDSVESNSSTNIQNNYILNIIDCKTRIHGSNIFSKLHFIGEDIYGTTTTVFGIVGFIINLCDL